MDDESLALDLLEDNINKVPFLNLVKRCKNAFDAIETLQNEIHFRRDLHINAVSYNKNFNSSPAA